MSDVAPRLPTRRAMALPTPSWLSPRRIALVACALGTATLLAGGSAPFVGGLRTWSDVGDLAGFTIPLTLVTVVATWLGARASSPSTALQRMLGAGAAGGAISLTLYIGVMSLVSPNGPG